LSNKTWRIEVEGQQHVIEVQTGSFTGGGSLTVDGKVANKWGASISGLPPRIKFEVQGKKAEIKRKCNIETIEKRLWSVPDTLRANSNYTSNEYF